MIRLKLITLFILTIHLLFCFGQNNESLGGYKFIENKNQWPKQVSFRTDIQSGYIYFENDGFLFDMFDGDALDLISKAHYKKTPKRPDSIHCHNYKMQFLNCNIPTFEKDFITPEYYNYFKGNDPSKWASRAYGYHRIKYKNIYDGIDVQIYSKIFNLKYDYIVKPHSDPSQIQVKYNYVDEIAIKNDRLHIYTSVNHIIEDKPYAYQIINGTKKEINCKYVLENKTVRFEFPNGYDEDYELIIDPTLMFSTYSGSFSDNFGYSATFDSKGFLYAGSSAFGALYPIVNGSYDISFNGGDGLYDGIDIAISKFDTTGTFLIYSTYLGGQNDELPHSLIVNSFDELFILGTTSSTDFPYTTGCFDSTFNGGTLNDLRQGLGSLYINGSDIIVTHLSTDGSYLLGSTYVGGSANDGLNSTSSTYSLDYLKYNYADEVRGEIDIDNNNNIYVVSCTRSNDFPIVGNVFQNTYGGGSIDGCVFKIENNLQNMIWSSYIGGSDHDAGYSLALDDSNNIYITGGTRSADFPVTAGSLSTTYEGGRSDGFISLISSDGQQVISSSFYGSPTYDQSYFVELDNLGNVFLLGQTEVMDSTYIKNVTWSIPGSGQYISKITPNLDSLIYSTVFGSGTGINISPTAFLVDLCSKMYLAGWGGAVNDFATANNAGTTNGMPITTDAYQATTDGSDFYVMVLEDDASGIVYGSYFGGGVSAEHVDGGTSRFDRKGKIYQAICAGCGGNSDLPIYPSNAVSPQNNNSCNLGVFKMDFNLPVVVADFTVPPIECAPYTANFTNTSLSQLYTDFFWDFGDGIGTSTQENPSYTYNLPGTYEVQLILHDTSTCNFGDTVRKFLTIRSNESTTAPTINLCPEDTIQIGIPASPDINTTYSWNPAIGLSDNMIAAPLAFPDTTTNYILFISNGSCVDTLYQPISLIDFHLDTANDTTYCLSPVNINYIAGSGGTADIFIWSTNNLFNDTLNNIGDSSFQTVLNFSKVFYIKATKGSCTLTDSTTTTLAPLNISLLPSDTVCKSDTVSIAVTNNNPADILSYIWSPTNEILGSSTSQNIILSPTHKNDLSVIVSNGFCKDTLYSTIFTDSIFLFVSNDTVLCNPNAIVTINATTQNTSNNYIWSLDPLFSNIISSNNSISVSPDTNTTFYVQVNNNYCSKQDSVIVGFAGNQIDLFGNQYICIGDTSRLEVINQSPFNALTYDWEPNEFIISGDSTNSILVAPSIPTMYYVRCVNMSGCIIIDSILVIPDPLPTLTANAWADNDTITNIGNTLLHVTPNGYTYNWTPENSLNNPNNQNPIAAPATTTTYQVIISGNSGCSKSAEVTVYVVEFECDEPYIYVPNAFTPNGDNINDVLYVRTTPTSEILFRIYDRWGELVFETTNKNIGWDGTFKGKESDPAVFDYYLEVLCPGNETYFKKGNITLIR